MIESPVIPTEILQRPKKKNITFEKTTALRSISTSISTPAVTPAPTSAAKTTTKTMKPVRQKLINKIRAKADPHKVILQYLRNPVSTSASYSRNILSSFYTRIAAI